jgi:hypothetical protein
VRWRPLLELLETRDLLAVGFAIPAHFFNHTNTVKPLLGPAPAGYSPAQIIHAYGIDQITFSGNTPGDGSNQTIAIVDAYDDPTIANDLKAFDTQFGLSDPTFTKVDQNGGQNFPTPDPGWAEEISLDVEWAHAIAPKAKILLVEATDNSFNNLGAAVSYAASQQGVVAVSMSWGGSEDPSETSLDSTFTTPTGHAGVTFVAASGDQGAPPGYPATSPNVLAAGGTTLNLDSNGNIISETGWSGSGGGISSVESLPPYQQNAGISTTLTQYGARLNPDVAYNADPNTGYPIYMSLLPGYGPWFEIGGTSAAAPQWSALIAIADQGRAIAGKGSLDGPSETLPKLYSLPSSDFNDITSGNNGYPAGPGYDLVTGLGSPVANKLVADLVGAAPTNTIHFSISAPSTATAGQPFNVTVTALDSSNNVDTGYTGIVQLTSSDGSAVFAPATWNFTGADGGTHTFSVTLKTAGSQTVTAADTDTSKHLSATATITVNPGTATQLAFVQPPTSATIGATITPAVTVKILDAYNNILTGDNTDQVSLTIGTNPGGGTLSGTNPVTVNGGLATFNNLSINKAGTGYTLVAHLGNLTVTSSAFNIFALTRHILEDFEPIGNPPISALSRYHLVGYYAPFYTSTVAAHDGTFGLEDMGSNSWIYRNDTAATVHAGDTVSAWVKFGGYATGRAYFGFGASAAGTLSLVAAPNTNQLIIQNNSGYGFVNLGAVAQTYQANHWYRLEVTWGDRTITGRIYDSNGTSLLNTVTGTNTSTVSSGGIAFRATGYYPTYFDTVVDNPIATSALATQHAVGQGIPGSDQSAPAAGVFDLVATDPNGTATTPTLAPVAGAVETPNVTLLAVATTASSRAVTATLPATAADPSVAPVAILLPTARAEFTPAVTLAAADTAPRVELVGEELPGNASNLDSPATFAEGMLPGNDTTPVSEAAPVPAGRELLVAQVTDEVGAAPIAAQEAGTEDGDDGSARPDAMGAAGLAAVLCVFWALPPETREETRQPVK